MSENNIVKLEVTEAEVVKQEAVDTEMKNIAEELLLKGIKRTKFGEYFVYIKHPNPKEQSALQTYYATEFSKLLKTSELMTKRQMMKILADREIWTQKDEDDLEDLRTRYIEYYKEWYSWKYEERAGNEEFLKLDRLYAETFKMFIKLNQQREELLENTIEKIIENKQILQKMQMCIFKDEACKEKLFKDIKEIEETDNTLAITALENECVVFWMGISERFLEQLPETITGKGATQQ